MTAEIDKTARLANETSETYVPHSDGTMSEDTFESAPKGVGTLQSVAVLYVVVVSVFFLWLASMGARPLPLLFIAADVALYWVSIRNTAKKQYGKATGYMIAAGILNLPLGIFAIIVGISVRRSWQKWEKDKLRIPNAG